MAVNIFFDLKTVTGESQVKGYEGKMQLLAWSWGMSQTGTMHHGTGGGAGKVNVQDLSITRNVDKASPTLMVACCTGKHFDEAVLTMHKASGDAVGLAYLTIKLKNILITSVSSGSSAGDEQQTENITLNFASFEVSYQAQDEKGSKKDGAVTVKYDIAKNTV